MFYIRVRKPESDPFYIRMEENATIRDVKEKLQEYLSVPKEQLEILTSERTLGENESISEINVEGSDSDGDVGGNPVMVYGGTNFLTFIRVLTEENYNMESLLEPYFHPSQLEFKKSLQKGLGIPTDTDEDQSLAHRIRSRHQGCGNPSVQGSFHRPADACGLQRCKPDPEQCMGEICRAARDEATEKGQIPPFENILPQNRQFILVVTTSCSPKCYCPMLKGFYKIFAQHRRANTLEFNIVTPVLTFGGRVYIAPADNATMEWVEKGVCSVGEPYSVQSLISFLDLVPCSVIWPQVAPACEPELTTTYVLGLLEAQNCELSTQKWCVESISRLDEKSNEYSAAAVTHICPNDRVNLYIDKESAEYIRDRCNHLRYCFWMLNFEFCGD